MNNDLGFTKKQLDQLGGLLTTRFVDLFNEIVLPGLETLSDKIDRIESRLDKIEARLTSLEEKVEDMRVELLDVKRKLTDLENSTVEMSSYLGLKKRVETLEYKVGIAV